MTRATVLELPEILPVLPNPDEIIYPYSIVPMTITKPATADPTPGLPRS